MASARTTSLRSPVLAGALMWLVQPLHILCELVAAAAVTAPYNLMNNTISDLGATTCSTIAHPYGDITVCSPLHALVNGAFVFFGLLMALDAVLLLGGSLEAPPRRPWWCSGSSRGSARSQPDRCSSTGTGDAHTIVALPAFVAQSL